MINNSPLGFFLGPSTNPSIVDELMGYVKLESIMLYRGQRGRLGTDIEHIATYLVSDRSSVFAGESDAQATDMTLSYDEEGNFSEDGPINIEKLTSRLWIPTGFEGASSIECFTIEDKDIAFLNLENDNSGGWYRVEFTINDEMVTYFVNHVNALKDTRDWIDTYKSYTELSCNYNEHNDRFNSFFQDYIAEAYGSFDDFEDQLSTKLDAIISATKYLECISDEEAENLKSTLTYHLHPDTARPSGLQNLLDQVEGFETIFA